MVVDVVMKDLKGDFKTVHLVAELFVLVLSLSYLRQVAFSFANI